MSNCNEIREQISLYIDGELDEIQRAEFEEHISSCTECRNELDEIMSIISMCNGIEEEELPDNFKEELHSKLLAVKEENMRKNKVVKLRSRYTKIISAVAACLLIVVLARGFLYDSFFPKYTKNGPNVTDMGSKKDLAEGEKVEMSGFSVGSDNADNTAGNNEAKESGDVMDGVQQFGIMAEPKSIDAMPDNSGDITSRSTDPGQRKQFLQESNGKNIYSNNVVINVKVNGELDSEVQNIRKLAVDGGGEFSEKSDEVSITSEPQKAVDGQSTETALNFKILYNQYQNFFNSLTEYVGSENITAEKSSQDMSNLIDSYNTRLNEIDDEISRIEKSGNSSSPDAIKSLEEERQLLINEIEKIMLDSDYIFVTIYIQQNEVE